jgi:hypothetical protein
VVFAVNGVSDLSLVAFGRSDLKIGRVPAAVFLAKHRENPEIDNPKADD